MNKAGNITAYITKKYNIEKDAYSVAKCALEKIVHTKWGIDSSLLPDTSELFDAQDEAAELIKQGQFNEAAIMLNTFAETYQFLT